MLHHVVENFESVDGLVDCEEDANGPEDSVRFDSFLTLRYFGGVRFELPRRSGRVGDDYDIATDVVDS
jgi:hypothetical protein